MNKIPLFKIHTTQEDIDAITKVVKRGSYWAIGPEIEEFEKELSNYMGSKYCVTFNSGTSALHAIMLAYEVKNKEVIVPSFTFISTATSVIMAGGIPIFAETEGETFGMDFNIVKEKITEKTKAVINIHYAGFISRDNQKIKDYCEENNILFIEDNAESMGAEINDKKAGTIGNSGMISFCQNKIIATGEGGAIITNDEKTYEKLKKIRSHGRVENTQDYFSTAEDSDYILEGYNWRMPTMIAALGNSQLKNIEKVIKLRREKAKYIIEKLKNLPIQFPKEIKNSKAVYQMFTIILEDEEIRNKLQNYLISKNIMCKVYFHPSHLKTIYKKRYETKEGDLPKTEIISMKVLTLPFFPDIKYEELDLIIKNVKDFFTNEETKK